MTNTLTIDQALQQAVEHHMQGQLQEAEHFYRAILQVQPDHPDANNNLGVLAVQLNQPAASLPYFKAAVEANPNQEQYWRRYIDALIQAGQIDAARQALEQGRQHGLQGEALEALIMRLEDSVPAVEQSNTEAVREIPHSPSKVSQNSKKKSKTKLDKAAQKSAQNQKKTPSPQQIDELVGMFNQGRYAEAINLAQVMTECFPLHAFGWKALGAILKQTGRTADALLPMQKAAALSSGDAEAHNNLGLTLYELGRLEEAENSYRRALQASPNYAEAHFNLGNTLNDSGRFDEAEACYRRTLQINPNDVDAHYNLSNILFKDMGRLNEAEAGFRQVLKIKPDHAEAYNNLGLVLNDLGRQDEAEASYRHAIQMKSDYAEAYSNLSIALKDLGRLDEAEESARRALHIKPDFEIAFSNLLFALNYHPDKSGEEIFEVYREYDAQFGLPYQSEWQAHGNSREINRRLKVGYVSPDFRHHSVRHFLEPLLAHHDKRVVEVYAYADLAREDSLTARYKNYVDHWIPTRGMTDAELAERIRVDGIDILADLAGHTAQNRLQVFARKPAPVSVSWLGYGYTTGLTAIDYYLGDEASAPSGCENVFSEQPWRIETPSCVYRPAEGMGEVNALPALERGYVTFGTLTRAVRINHRTLRVWAELLKRVPGSRLVIDSRNFQHSKMQEALADKFAALGIERERLEIGYHSPPWDVLRGTDIGLDCFPHNSGTTLFENLYMGLPFVTLAGRPSVGCLGKTVLEGLGHPEWVADSEDQYVEIAAGLASDLGRLAQLRAGLRDEMRASALMDEPGFARKVETAYREMWAISCKKSNDSGVQEINAQVAPVAEAATAYLEDGVQIAEQSKTDNQQAAGETLPVLPNSKKKSKTKMNNLLEKSAQNQEKSPGPQEINALVTLFNDGRYPEAISLAQTMTERFPLYGFGWKALGAMFKQVGRNADALVPMQKAAELSPADAEAHNNLGLTLHDLGRLDEAQISYRRALKIKPDYAEAHFNLAVTLTDLGRLDEAEAGYRRAVKINPNYVEAHYNLGNLFKALSRLEEAEAGYRRALEIAPNHAAAHNNLGLIFNDQGRLEEAEASFRRALDIEPDYAGAHSNLGNTLMDRGRLDEAEASCRHALELNPNLAELHYNLGNILHKLGRIGEAESSFRRALDIEPDYAGAHSNLGNALMDLGRLDEAEACFRRTLEIKPDYAEAYSNLGNVLCTLGRFDEAEQSCRLALAIKPDYAQAHNNLGNILKDLGRLDEAEASYQLSLEFKPDLVEAHNNLGNVLCGLGRMEDAEESCRQALSIKPDYAEAYASLAAILNNLGRLDEAEECYRRTLQIKPDFETVFSNWLFGLNYHPDKSGEEIFEIYREYNARFGLPHQREWQPHNNSREINRRLKVGYVSPDFRHHSVRHFLEPLLAHHDKQAVEVYAYADLVREDSLTVRYKSYVDQWIPIRGMTDAALAERIRADGIDILVDLAGHTAGNRLQVFARKPAPVSVSWLGYGYTTGLTAIDYYLGDEASAPSGCEKVFSEQPWRLATPSFVYRPAEDMGEVNALPALERGYVTFGTLTRAIRINHRTLRVWAKMLKRVPNSRLVINSGNFKSASMQEMMVDKFAALGIERERLEIGHQSPPWDVLRGIDIMLDCFPHNSGTTLIESLYMGLPFVTLAGRPSMGCLGKSVLEGLGHPEWVADTEDQYVEIAAGLASDLGRLAQLRAGLRDEMQAGALMDEPGFARKVETAYREMWAISCNKSNDPAVQETSAQVAPVAEAATLAPTECVEEGIQIAEQPKAEHQQAAGETLPVLPNSMTKPETKPDKLSDKSARNKERSPSPQEINALVGLFSEGKYAQAITQAQDMTVRFPLHGFGWKVLGAMFKQLGRNADALIFMQKAAELSPDDAEAHSNLGMVLRELGQLDEAENSYRRALKIKPDYAEVHFKLAVTLTDLGRLDEAEAGYRRALQINPNYAEAHYNLGNLFKELSRLEEAEASYRRVLATVPNHAEAHNNLGLLCSDQGRLEEAEVSLCRALEIKPDLTEAYNNLGNVLCGLGRLGDAEDCCRQALAIKPDSAEAYASLAAILNNQGRLDEGEECYRRTLQIKPDFEVAFSNLLFALNYHPDKSGEEIFEAYREYDAKFGLPYQSEWQPHHNSRETQRRLKVGYVSPDFRHHSVRHFLEPLLAHHDKQAVEVYAYADLAREDYLTARYKVYVDQWIPTRGMTDTALAERIRADGIDILVDLAGHTAENRLQVFARKPAPVSVSWLGYGYTTGLTAIDYYLGDEASAPSGCEKVFSEQPWRLETPSFAYRPAEDMGEVNALPALERGYVTFGTLTRAIRINHRTLRVWAKMLKRVPNSRLVINSGNFKFASMQEMMVDKFAALGIERERLEIGHQSPPWDVLRGVDIMLDCFPHNSGTTLIESLYMGLPFVTLAGRPSMGCLGKSVLEGLGHPEWVAGSEDQYVEIAVGLASDLGRLAQLRAGLRDEMRASALMDEPGFARKVETAYREMWAISCNKPNDPGVQETHAQAAPVAEAATLAPTECVEEGIQIAEQSKAENQQAAGETPPILPNSKKKSKTTQDKSLKKSALHKGKNPSPQEINALVTLFNDGRYPEAISLARTMTERFPQHGFGWKALGALFKQVGRHADALVPMQKAAALSPADAEAHNNLGLTLHDLGRLDEAQISYRRALKIKPDYAEAHFNLAVTLCDLGRLDEAEAGYRRAVKINPNYVEAHYNLGNLFKALSRLEEAEAGYRRALEIAPNHAAAHNNLGLIFNDQGRLEEAGASFCRAMEISPNYAEAYSNLGNTLMDMGRLDEAEASCRHALELNPNLAELHYNLGNILHKLGRIGEAESSFRRALDIEPDYAGAHSNLGNALMDLGRFNEAEACFRRTLEIKPDYAEAYSNLGNVLCTLGRLDEAEQSCRLALAISPDFAEAHTSLAGILQDLGRLDEAEESYRRTLQIKPDFENVFSNMLFALNYHPDKSGEEIFEVYREYDAKFGLPFQSEWQQHNNSRETQRRLKVGYVSPDFRQHSTRHFLEPLLAHHDKQAVEVYAYADLAREDDLTARYKNYVDQWIPTRGMTDAALAERIRADGIDILVELAGHTAGNRLQVFARKPAPVSMSWLGYGYTTGLTAIDYYLGDEVSTPPGCEKVFSEQPWRIATPSCVYRPAEGMGEVNALPALARGYVTFGTLTRSIRINHRTIRVWAKMLKRVPGSRLVIDSRNFQHTIMQEAMADKFAALGIERERLEIGHHSPPWDVLRGIDIMLDCFPHNSGTTLIESLYMGLPFVTLAGRPSMGCLGKTVLEGLGHPEWVADTEDQYVEIAANLASDLGRLAQLRARLRDEMQASALMDEPGFARKVENAYREMWIINCNKGERL